MLLKVERVDILDDEAVIDITIRRLELRPGEPYLRAGEFRLSYGTARELYKALGEVLNGHSRHVEIGFNRPLISEWK